MGCPNCRSSNFNQTHKQTDGQGYWELETYECEDCGCEWTWEMKKDITFQGKPEEFCECKKEGRGVTLVKDKYYTCDKCGDLVSEDKE